MIAVYRPLWNIIPSFVHTTVKYFPQHFTSSCTHKLLSYKNNNYTR